MRINLHFVRAQRWLLPAYIRTYRRLRSRHFPTRDLPKHLTKERSRLKHYAYGSTYLAVLMGSLRNRSLSCRERFLFEQLSDLAAAFDELAEQYIRANPSLSRPEGPEVFGRMLDPDGPSLRLLHSIETRLSEAQRAGFHTQLQRVFQVEMDGRQIVPGAGVLTLEELETITAEKGGASVLLFRSVLDPELSTEEADALSRFGYLIQLCDDIFDLWQDAQAGIETLATYYAARNTPEFLADKFEAQVKAVEIAFRRPPYPAGQQETSLQVLLFLVSITRLCLNHYRRLKQQHGVLPVHNRTLMVVDMEKWPNLLRAMGYFLGLNQKI